jgi:hypothetical protein
MDHLFEHKPIWHAHSAVIARLREEEERFRHEIEESGFTKDKTEQVENVQSKV